MDTDLNRRWHGLRTFGSTQINADIVSIHLRYPFYPRNLRFLDNGFLTTDDTDVRRLRTFGSTLMFFLFICGIRFISVICGSQTTVF
jgi:hypothetical protein